MDHYKKQRVQMSGLRNGRTLDIIATSDGEEVEHGTLSLLEKTDELLLASDTDMPGASVVTSDQGKPEAVSQTDVQEIMEELVSTPFDAVQDDIHAENLIEAGQTSTPKSSEETEPVFNGDKVDGVISEKVISVDADIDHPPSPNNANQAATVFPSDGDNMDEISGTEGNSSVYSAVERQAVADATTGPLFFSEGSPKVTGALIPGSNESESVILSRIHHSPESTR